MLCSQLLTEILSHIRSYSIIVHIVTTSIVLAFYLIHTVAFNRGHKAVSELPDSGCQLHKFSNHSPPPFEDDTLVRLTETLVDTKHTSSLLFTGS